jgi:hypothetical protein
MRVIAAAQGNSLFIIINYFPVKEFFLSREFFPRLPATTHFLLRREADDSRYAPPVDRIREFWVNLRTFSLEQGVPYSGFVEVYASTKSRMRSVRKGD